MPHVSYIIAFFFIFSINGTTTNTSEGSLSDVELMTFTEQLLKEEESDLNERVLPWIQGRTATSCLADHAPQPLLWLDRQVFTHYPTVTRLLALYNKYDPNINNSLESVEMMDREDEYHFIDAVLDTNIMKFTRNFLIRKRLFTGNEEEFKYFLEQIWFTLYRRETVKKKSSAFEHVFLGEVKVDGSVLGLHNWLFFYREEALHNLNYLGWIQKIYFGKGTLLKHHFVWRGHNKPIGTMFIGTTPEFELSLYTACFLARPNDRCYFSLGGNTLYIKTYMFVGFNGKMFMGSAYPGM